MVPGAYAILSVERHNVQEVSGMAWKLTHKKDHDVIENEHGKTLSYYPNLGIQIIEQDGYAFKDLNGTGILEIYEDWRRPLSERIQSFKSVFGLWQEGCCLYYHRGKIIIPDDVYEQMLHHLNRPESAHWSEAERSYLKENYLLGILLLMFDNDEGTGKEDYLLQLMLQSMKLGVLENIMYSIWEAVRRYLHMLNGPIGQKQSFRSI